MKPSELEEILIEHLKYEAALRETKFTKPELTQEFRKVGKAKPMVFTVVAVLPETGIEVQVSELVWLHWVEACEWMANHPSYMCLKVEGFTEYQI